MLGWSDIGLILLCAANISLGILVIAHDPRAKTNRLFLATVIVVVGWISSISLALSAHHPGRTVVLGRVGFAFATLMPFALLCLFSSFNIRKSKRTDRVIVAAGVFCGIFAGISFSPWVVSGASMASGRENFLYGPLHPILGIYVVGCLAVALWVLWTTAQASFGIRRVQLRYLLCGVLLGGLGIIATNLVIPLVWRSSYYSVFGPYFTLVFVSFSAHAIIRHRLMDIRIFVRKGVVYVSALAVTSVAFLATATLMRQLSGGSLEYIPITVAVGIALMTTIGFPPLKNMIQSSLNRYFYREDYDYQRIVRDISRELGTMLDLTSLIAFLTREIQRTFKSEFVAVYLRQGDAHFRLEAVTTRGYDTTVKMDPLTASSDLVRYLESERHPILADESRQTPKAQGARAELKAAGGELAIPILDGVAVSGVLLMGRRLSGDAYLTADLDLLLTLVGQAAIAIKNANLYREVLVTNERIANIVETMEGGVVAVGPTGIVTHFNSAAEKISRLPAASVKGAQVNSLPAAIAEPILATLTDGKSRVQVETVLPHAAGAIPVIYSTSVLRDRSGDIFGVVAAFSDLTKIRELEAEKRRTERLASIGAFASGIAHEIKNPLVAIKTFVELLPERIGDDEFRNDFLRVAMHEVKRIDELVGRLRGFVTSLGHEPHPVLPREVVDELLILLRGQLEQSRISVSVQDDAGGQQVPGDRDQIKQLLLNLFINAIEAMPSGGALEIYLGLIERAAVQRFLLQVSDTGHGISADIWTRIFDPFVTTKPQGSGLGLSICRNIVEAHRGTIRAEQNAHGRGTTFIVELPVCRAGVNTSVWSEQNGVFRQSADIPFGEDPSRGPRH